MSIAKELKRAGAKGDLSNPAGKFREFYLYWLDDAVGYQVVNATIHKIPDEELERLWARWKIEKEE